MKVELVTKTIGIGKYENLTSEEIISAIARHGIIKEDNGKLVKYLMDQKHWSPLDMINFTFEIETSRAIGRQILRHSSIKFQEHSQRYSDKVEFENIELRKEHPTNRQSSTDIITKIKFRNDTVLSTIPSIKKADYDKYGNIGFEILKHIREAKELYQKGIDLGIAKECMRNILPECTTSTLSANGTLRSWLSFLNVRLDHHAQKEVQEIAQIIGENLQEQLPNVFSTIDWRKGMFM